MSLGGPEIIVILLVALIVFGPQRLPEIGRQIGKAMSEVRKMQDSVRREIHGAINPDGPDNVAHGMPSYGELEVPPNGAPGDAPALPHPDSPAGPSADRHTDSPSAGSFS